MLRSAHTGRPWRRDEGWKEKGNGLMAGVVHVLLAPGSLLQRDLSDSAIEPGWCSIPAIIRGKNGRHWTGYRMSPRMHGSTKDQAGAPVCEDVLWGSLKVPGLRADRSGL